MTCDGVGFHLIIAGLPYNFSTQILIRRLIRIAQLPTSSLLLRLELSFPLLLHLLYLVKILLKLLLLYPQLSVSWRGEFCNNSYRGCNSTSSLQKPL